MSNGNQESMTVLIADDEEAVRRVTQLTLERSGFTTLLACAGQEAIELFRLHADAVDAVLADMTMPDMDGVALCNAVHRIRARVPVVLSSGYGADDAMRRCEDSGPVSFLAKPYRPGELVERMREILVRI